MDNKYGLVLDGEVAVGKFIFATDEDKFGQRQFLKLALNSDYVNVFNGRTKDLRCLLVEKISENQITDLKISTMTTIENPICVQILEDLGTGVIGGKFSINDRMAHYESALFIKTPKKLNSKLN